MPVLKSTTRKSWLIPAYRKSCSPTERPQIVTIYAKATMPTKIGFRCNIICFLLSVGVAGVQCTKHVTGKRHCTGLAKKKTAYSTECNHLCTSSFSSSGSPHLEANTEREREKRKNSSGHQTTDLLQQMPHHAELGTKGQQTCQDLRNAIARGKAGTPAGTTAGPLHDTHPSGRKLLACGET